MLRMRSFPFSVAPFSVTPLVAGVEKVCIRQGPPFDRSGNRDSAETLQFHPATDRGDRSGEEIYYETQVAGSDLCAAAPPPKDWARTKLELDGLYGCPILNAMSQQASSRPHTFIYCWEDYDVGSHQRNPCRQRCLPPGLPRYLRVPLSRRRRQAGRRDR